MAEVSMLRVRAGSKALTHRFTIPPLPLGEGRE